MINVSVSNSVVVHQNDAFIFIHCFYLVAFVRVKSFCHYIVALFLCAFRISH